jgi:hypothetical protein
MTAFKLRLRGESKRQGFASCEWHAIGIKYTK